MNLHQYPKHDDRRAAPERRTPRLNVSQPLRHLPQTGLAEHPSVPQAIVAHLRAICLALPEVHENAAWAGLAWTVRSKNFAQVLTIENNWPPAYARAAGTAGPACVLTFRSPLPLQDARSFTWAPFFRPAWLPDIAGMTLDAQTDWSQVAGLIRSSYEYMAPQSQKAKEAAEPVRTLIRD